MQCDNVDCSSYICKGKWKGKKIIIRTHSLCRCPHRSRCIQRRPKRYTIHAECAMCSTNIGNTEKVGNRMKKKLCVYAVCTVRNGEVLIKKNFSRS